jgi:hypothetical protein
MPLLNGDRPASQITRNLGILSCRSDGVANQSLRRAAFRAVLRRSPPKEAVR